MAVTSLLDSGSNEQNTQTQSEEIAMDKLTLDALFVSLSSASAAPLPLANGFSDMYQEFVDAQVGPDDKRPGVWSKMAAHLRNHATAFGRSARSATGTSPTPADTLGA
jgi:hypothetical protein